MSEWQPVETAPLGVFILVHSADGEITMVEGGEINGKISFWHQPTSRDSENAYNVTHWMPLPAPPVT